MKYLNYDGTNWMLLALVSRGYSQVYGSQSPEIVGWIIIIINYQAVNVFFHDDSKLDGTITALNADK